MLRVFCFILILFILASCKKNSPQLNSEQYWVEMAEQVIICIFIKDEKKNHKVSLSEIEYIKADGNYTSVNLKDRHIFSQMKISDFEKLLPKESFSRIHRSYLIAHHAITLIKANEIQINEVFLPVGRIYKENIRNLLNDKIR